MTPLEMEKVHSMPRCEKLQKMEALWEDLSREQPEPEYPDWHRQVLRKTEQRVRSGRETTLNWSEAKQQLRARCE